MTMHPQSTGEGRGVTSPDLPPYQPPQSGETGGAVNRSGDGLPDIIHSHYVGHALPPRPGQHHSAAAAASRHQRHRHHQHQGRGGGERSRGTRDDGGQNRRRRERRRTHSSSSATQAEDEGCKEPCLKCVAAVTSIRWLLLMMSLLGVLFVVAGIVMAVLHAIGNDFLVYALAFIGLGVILVVVVVVAWRCTPQGSEPIHSLFRIGDSRPQPHNTPTHREHRPRRTRRRRDGQWHGGMLYPEFQYRRPPPSYTASMLASQGTQPDVPPDLPPTTTPSTNNNNDGYSLPRSSPPSYRSRASTIQSGIHITFPPGRGSAPSSRPPTYRSRADSRRRPGLPEEFDTSSPHADVAFTGPEMTADRVQQLIGTGHRRQQSAGAVVWHSQSVSGDMSAVAHHRRGSSLSGPMLAATSRPTSQANLPSSQRGALLPTSESGALEESRRTVQPSSDIPASVEQAVTVTVAPTAENTASSETGTGQSVARQQQSGGVSHTTVSMTTDGHDSEPEEYNTAL